MKMSSFTAKNVDKETDGGNISVSSIAKAYTDASMSNSFLDTKSGMKIDDMSKHMTALKNYQQEGQLLVAKQIVNNVLNKNCNIQDKFRFADLGCGIATDLEFWQNEFQTFSPTKSLELHGVDLMNEILKTAKKNLPEAMFWHKDLKDGLGFFESNSLDVIHCRRVLIHLPNAEDLIHEMIRVLSDGGYGILVEGELDTGTLHTEDDRLKKVENSIRLDKFVANPNPASKAYRILKVLEIEGQIKNVQIRQELISLILDQQSFDPCLKMTRGRLSKQMEAGVITEEDIEYFINKLEQAPRTGDPFTSGLMFVISFEKC